ncbi:unnamed protein product [Schistosoma mattheei]|uniref:Uncharacterized protein n=1 Tax=Schistosoma mattheei TaxID=31246 RepID=A0A183P802_9TREM|nr:unnamed protein product [Schistosoma mattheei]
MCNFMIRGHFHLVNTPIIPNRKIGFNYWGNYFGRQFNEIFCLNFHFISNNSLISIQCFLIHSICCITIS